MAVVEPTDLLERELAQQVRATRGLAPDALVTVVGIDEVGRGAIAGPLALVAVALVLDADGPTASLPAGVRDSKSLTARARERLELPLRESVRHGLGWVQAEEIDDIGIGAALTQGALRALDALAAQGILPDAILLDGTVDTLSASLTARAAPGAQPGEPPLVRLRAKADRDCLSVAAASVLAKTARDRVMVALDETAPQYGWAKNKGYGSAAHRAAISEIGAHPEHRLSWSLPLPAGAASAQALRGAADVRWTLEPQHRGKEQE